MNVSSDSRTGSLMRHLAPFGLGHHLHFDARDLRDVSRFEVCLDANVLDGLRRGDDENELLDALDVAQAVDERVLRPQGSGAAAVGRRPSKLPWPVRRTIALRWQGRQEGPGLCRPSPACDAAKTG